MELGGNSQSEGFLRRTAPPPRFLFLGEKKKFMLTLLLEIQFPFLPFPQREVCILLNKNHFKSRTQA